MTKKSNFKRKMLLIMSLFSMFTVALPAGSFAGESSSPVLAGSAWDGSGGGTLLGGLQGKEPVDIFHGLTVKGKPLVAEDGCPDLGENPAVTTPLLKNGQALAFYTLAGEELGTATVENVEFMCMEVSGQSMLTPLLGNVVVKKKNHDGPWLGLAAGTQFGPVPTEKKDLPDGSFAFEAESGALRVVFSRFQDQDEELFMATLHHKGKEKKLFDLPVGEVDEGLAGGFVDIGADGSPEFFFMSQGPAGRVAVYATGSDSDAAQWFLDTGE